MIRVEARPFDDLTIFEIRRAGEFVYATTDAIEAVQWLLDLGVDNPMPLLEAAAHWGKVDIHESADANGTVL